MNDTSDYDEEWLNEPYMSEAAASTDEDECFDVDGW